MIKVKARNKADRNKAKAIQGILNYSFSKLMDIPELREKIARHIIRGEPMPAKEEMEKYFKQIIK